MTCVIDCSCGIRLCDYTTPPDAPVAVRRGDCYMEADCPACGTPYRVHIPASEPQTCSTTENARENHLDLPQRPLHR